MLSSTETLGTIHRGDDSYSGPVDLLSSMERRRASVSWAQQHDAQGNPGHGDMPTTSSHADLMMEVDALRRELRSAQAMELQAIQERNEANEFYAAIQEELRAAKERES